MVDEQQREMDDSWRAALSSTKLAYMRFIGIQIPRTTYDPVRSLFNAVQSLALVDVGACGTTVYKRWHRNSTVEAIVQIPYRSWQPWWKSARDDIEDVMHRCR